VAIKVLPEHLAEDEQRLRRFEREAKSLASLNHPNVAQIFGVDHVDGTWFLVLELVPGETLADRIERGALPIDEAVDVCRQIAEGLEAAHEAGVIHRDLKPANVRITPDGKVKVLDFGLAKPTGAGPTVSSTIDSVLTTEEGRLLGTPTYMAPEQARGKPIDKRVDVWAFGCVLHECLAGRRAFEGETMGDVLAAVLEKEPDRSRLPPSAPERLRELLQRCLRKDPRSRLRDVGDARILLEELRTGTRTSAVAEPRAGRRLRVSILVVAVALAAAAGAWMAAEWTRLPAEPRNPLETATFTKVTDFAGTEFDAAISRDGSFLAFMSDQDGQFDAWIGQIGAGTFRNLTRGRRNAFLLKVRDVGFDLDGTHLWLGGGTGRRVESVPILGGDLSNYFPEGVVNLDWSPDGTRVAYHGVDGDPLFVAEADGSNPRQILVHGSGMHQHYPTWSFDGQWIFVVRGRPATLEMELWRVRPDGTDLEQLTEGKLDVGYPAPIDADTVLFVAREPNGAGPWLWALDLKSGVSRRISIGVEQYRSIATSEDGRRLVATVANPSAHLWRVPILADAVATEADAEPVEELVGIRALAPRFGKRGLHFLSSHGTEDGLWRLADGKVEELLPGVELALQEPPAVSPDGESIAIVLKREGRMRLAIVSADGTGRRLLPDTVDVRGAGTWSPDAEWIAIGGSDAEGKGLFAFPADGGAPRRIVAGEAFNPVWSPTDDLIIYAGEQKEALHPLLGVRPSNGSRVGLPEIHVLRLGARARFLPDGRGLVYAQGVRPSQDFWLYDIESREKRQLTRLDEFAQMTAFDVDPSGDAIVFDRLQPNSDVVLIELAADAD
jgi:Tol biopolymer transport system component